MSWASLSTEIQWLILDHLRDFKCRQYESPTRRRVRRDRTGISQAAYASVCREWSDFFERANFEKLTLHQDDIATLGEVVPRCGALIRWIWLRIELPSYDCSLCDQPESVEEDKVNKFLFTDAVWGLFEILSQLNNDHHPGITLELSAHSPSIVDHYAQELGCMINDTAWHTLGGFQSSQSLDDESHGWRSGQRRRITDAAALRMVGHPQGLRFDLRAPAVKRMDKTLPRVRVVKALVIRGQCYRHISISKALDLIIRNLTQLRDLSYECWKGYDTAKVKGRHIRLRENDILLSDTLRYRRSLRKISIYEGTSRCNKKHLSPHLTWEHATVGFGSALAKASRDLEELYVNDIVEADDFFRPFWGYDLQKRATRRILWRNLRRISLFAELVPPVSYESRIQAAGHAACTMPQLEFMELWYCDGNYQCVFTYDISKDARDTHKLELRSSWGVRLSPATVQAWREAVCGRGPGRELEVRGQGEIFDLPKGRDLMCALVLRGDALTNTSRRQILGQHGHSYLGRG
ncbi:hypothetical protein BBK36DRAFT_1159857 [Trichoderma citrinoviride]|uniref:DUF6546 domain-containing protein n=1 Tax=Trichoderma citrinoviride TaxID=58853 RepID=A0A2T4B8R6_9HYPO|nr:hypothetical protein BBK36DRAFT_1159857 [Trichoderma citrinoviride]PTB65725.1 hypothetical protein BBK36DRAFT_1159857 [Trichoderma citrinoviride]